MTGWSVGPGEGRDATRASAGRGRGRWALILLLLSGVVALTGLPVWVTAAGASPLADEVTVSIRGTAAAPGLVAAALVLLAAAAAVGLVGRVGRWVVVVVVAAAGGLVVGSALGGRSGADASAARAAAEATGVSRLTGPPQVAAWPLVAVAVGVLVVVAAVGLARASGRWAAPSGRHDRPGTGTAYRVDVPSAGAAPPGARPRSPGRSEPPGDAAVRRGGSAERAGMRIHADSAGAGRDADADPARPNDAAVRPIGAGLSATGAPAVRSAPSLSDAPDAPDERATWDALTRGDDPT